MESSSIENVDTAIVNYEDNTNLNDATEEDDEECKSSEPPSPVIRVAPVVPVDIVEDDTSTVDTTITVPLTVSADESIAKLLPSELFSTLVGELTVKQLDQWYFYSVTCPQLSKFSEKMKAWNIIFQQILYFIIMYFFLCFRLPFPVHYL